MFKSTGTRASRESSSIIPRLLPWNVADRSYAGQGNSCWQRFLSFLAHTSEHVDRYLAAAGEVFSELAEAIQQNDIEERIGSPVRHSGFARLT